MSGAVRDDIDNQIIPAGTSYLHLQWLAQTPGQPPAGTTQDVKASNWDAAWTPVLQAYQSNPQVFRVTIEGKQAV